MPSLDSYLLSLRKSIYFRFLGLESNPFLSLGSSYDYSWFAAPGRHLHIISPGRSGTRWLSNVLLDLSKIYLCHSSRLSLASTGYLYDQSLISDSEIIGAYRHSRSHFLSLSSFNNSPYIDFDCKLSPISPVIASFYPNSMFLALLRDPISFIISGLRRGYFLNMSPLSWGHLESIPVDSSLPFQEWQIFKIAAFWRSIALVADAMINLYPERVFVLNCSKMFSDPSQLSSFLSWFNLSHKPVTTSTCYTRKYNASDLSVFTLSPSQKSLLSSPRLIDFCFDSLSTTLLNRSGIHLPP